MDVINSDEDLLGLTILLIAIGLAITITAYAVGMMMDNLIPPMMTYYNSTTLTPAGQALQAPTLWAQLKDVSGQIFVIWMIGVIVVFLLVMIVRKKKPQYPGYQ